MILKEIWIFLFDKNTKNHVECVQQIVPVAPPAPALVTRPSDCPHHFIGLPESPVKVAEAVPFRAPGIITQSYPNVVIPKNIVADLILEYGGSN